MRTGNSGINGLSKNFSCINQIFWLNWTNIFVVRKEKAFKQTVYLKQITFLSYLLTIWIFKYESNFKSSYETFFFSAKLWMENFSDEERSYSKNWKLSSE